ncbi:MAG: spindle pole body component (Alp6) [Lasallia pustulata]|uniref:Spindle pole body component (Alp6) n=1 Tax=Lasallia pustulata TaxID=136370 RepID=A0A5M8PRI9_9LECA|nr:MAG: spindle pole body component (Alp6) [Lasallia pustulata]
MGDEKSRRIDGALSGLIKNLTSSLPDEDEADAEERLRHAVQLGKSILHGHDDSVDLSDVNQAPDLIKKKLLRENTSPDKAVRFSNLYSRLLTQPVLSQKWKILYLLHRLAEPDAETDVPRDLMQARPTPTHGPPLEADTRTLNIGKQSRNSTPSADEGSPSYTGMLTRESHGMNRPRVNGHNEEDAGREGEKKVVSSAESVPALDTTDAARPSEASLLRDLPFTLQGLSSKNLPFSPPSTLILPPSLPLPLISLLHALAEPSLLYRSLSDFVQSQAEGLVSQSLRAAISSELRSYLGLIATLEGEIRRAIASLSEDESRGRIGKAGVTLKRCVVWTREATMGLRLMSLMAEESKSRKGGQLISMIHGFSSSHGDPFVGAFAERMLVHVTRPFYDMLRQWIYDGELADPYHEFFVTEHDPRSNPDTDVDPRRAPASSVWEDKYKLDDGMVPSIIAEDFARKIFLIGKSLNFIRYGCGDSAWVEAYSKDASRELRYGDTATLETSIDKAYKTTMARLIHLMDDKFQLFEHLRALKKYLLLGQGDFIALLMESLASNLDRPAGSQYRHTLTAQLEHAIRGSNAQYDSPDVLRRLDARLLELSHGEIGWDVFTLEYKVDAPVDVVITPWASKQYLVVFNFLWRIKRVEFALGSTWRRCMTGARGVLANVSDRLGRDWKVARCCIAEMIHFVNQLQYYILFEVIEASWDQLQAAITKPDCTLDDLIGAHTKYLKAITHKGLLGSAKVSSTGNREDSFTGQLHQILKLMLAYKEAVDGLYSFSVAEFTRKQEFSAKIETRTAQGKWGITGKDEEDLRSPSPAMTRRETRNGIDRNTDSPFPISGGSGEDQMLPSLRTRLRDLSADFTSRVNTLLGDLAYQPDVDMRFLGVVMNFNDVYSPKRKRREHHRSDRDRRTPGNPGESVVDAGEGGPKAEGKKAEQ